MPSRGRATLSCRSGRILGLVFRGWLLARRGDHRRGAAVIGDAVAAIEKAGHLIDRPYCLSLLADAHALGRGWAEADRCIRRALATAEQSDERWLEAELHRQHAAVLLGTDAQLEEAAERDLKQALTVAKAQEARLWELRAASDLARLWAERGERYRALELLAPVHGWFTEGLDTSDLRNAKELLEGLR